MKVIKYYNGTTYTGKDGKVYQNSNFFLELDNGKWIAIKPSFTKDYSNLDLISIKVVKE